MTNNTNTSTKMNDEAITKMVEDKTLTTSYKIRTLNEQGLSRGVIAKKLNIRYQWVRNVLITEVKTPKIKKSA